MRKIGLMILAGALSSGMVGAAMAADVSIAISGIRAANGPLYVSVQTEAQFLKNEGSHGTIIQEPVAGATTVVLPNVPAGDYSVSVWHDIDGDGVFDRAQSGLPLDGWSMYKAAALRGEPKFDEVKFKVTSQGAAISLDMVYAD